MTGSKCPKHNRTVMFYTAKAMATPPSRVQALLPDPLSLKLKFVCAFQ